VYIGTDEHYLGLTQREVLESYDYTLLSPRITERMLVPQNTGVQVYSTAPGILYNTDLIPAAEAPKRLEDTLAAKWKGKIASTQYAAYFDVVSTRPEWGVERMKGFVGRLSEQVGGLLRVGEESRVISGEFSMLVLGNTHSARQPQSQGAPLGYVIPADSAVVRFVHLGVPRNSGHPNLAKLFINTVMSPEGQQTLFDVYYVDHYALPGSRSAADFTDIKAQGGTILEVDVPFYAAHPEIRGIAAEYEKILREKAGG
jgi:ABC-type Fe3+ transport system substrate-binding protein